MKIIYKDNPLATIVTLTENEKREFWLKLKIAQLEEILASAWFDLESDTPNEDIRKILDIDYWCSSDGSKSKLDQRVDELCEIFIKELTENHIGDCTCVPCSCSKCYVEELLGVNTIDGLSKYARSMIESAFENATTIDEAIDWLDNYVPNRSKGGWDSASDERWESAVPLFHEHAEEASSWLKTYKKFLRSKDDDLTHF